MRIVTIDEHKFEVRGLLRGEVKELRREHDIVLVNLSPANAEEAQDRVFELIFSLEDLERIDALPNADALKLWQAVLKETYGAKDEEKN